jgi:YidC/Oxa1 family membrane protein insertase
MEKRVLIAVLLSFVVLYAYQALVPPPPEPPPATKSAAPAAGSGASAPGQTSAPGAPGTAEAATPGREGAQPGEAEREVVVDSPDIHAVFTTRGGALKSWQLKKYADANGQPLDLVPHTVPADATRPFTLGAADAGIGARLGKGSFTPSADAVTVGAGPQTLRFDYRDANGLTAEKTFTFSPAQPYVLTFSTNVTNNGQAVNPIVEWGPALGTGIVMHSRTYNPPPQPLFFKDGKVSRVAHNKITAQPTEDGTFGFAGVDDHYFATLAVSPGPLHLQYQPLDVPIPGVEDGAHFVLWSAKFGAPPQNARFFLGPKDFDILYSVDHDLVRTIDFGMFSWLVVPLLRALKWINGYIGNYGWSLITLTVLINLAMFPLRHKSVVSMRKMAEIQPEVKAIQDRYAKMKMSDPARQKMNVELMNLYRERGVNPASGCVPMLLTLPVLFAFYSLLAVAIELRGAPFIFWIRDLAAPDPLFVTPILMGITQLVQQKMVPAAADPTQQKMMLIMPVVFTAMFLWAPSGLVIYWTTTNLWGIGQQMITNKLIGPMKARTVRPPAERRMKRVGGGRTDQAKDRS